jgi:hypothetical protein
MAYEYDIFFSYRRDAVSDAWHENLKNKLRFWVGEEADIEEVRVFFDKEEIRTGYRWREKIAKSLLESKCIVCIWSPQYFRSRYCVAEWLSFHRRSELTNKNLVAPASRADGSKFPPLAKQVQMASFDDYFVTIPAFWESVRAAEFERLLIKPFARDVASLIRHAPPASSEFPIVDAEVEFASDVKLDDNIRIERIANVQ